MNVMKKLLSLAVFFTALFCSPLRAQEPVQYSVDLTQFSSVDLFGPFDVTMVKGQQYRVLISVMEPYREYVDCYVNAGVLSLKLDERIVPMEVKRQFRAKGAVEPVFSAVIYAPEELHTVSMSGKIVLHDTDDVFDKSSVSFSLDGQVQVKSVSLNTEVFKLDMKGKSVADFTLECDESLIDVAQSAQLAINETARNSYYKVQGSSKLRITNSSKSFCLIAKSNCAVNISGKGDRSLFDLGGTCEVDASRFDLSEADVRMSSVCKLYVAAADRLKLDLNSGSTLSFAGDPVIEIESIRSATVSRMD